MIGGLLFHVGQAGLPAHDDLMLLGPLLLILLIVTIVIVTVLANRGVLGDPERPVETTLGMAAIAAGLSFGAAAIHLAVVAVHLEDGVAFAAFFLVVGWFQMAWPLAYFLRRPRKIALVGLGVNLGIAGIWLVSRTIGVPFGPTPWVPEPIGLPDLFATVLELGIFGLLLPVALPDPDNERIRRLMPIKDAVILSAFAAAAVALLTSYALLAPVVGAQ